MKLVQKIKRRLGDMRTLKDTGLRAELIASEMGEALVGAEHWLLAALELPDGTANLSFSNAGADASLLRAAIAQQYQDALNDIGIDTAQLALSSAGDNTPEKPIVTFSAQESCKALFAIMADQDRFATESPRFMGATVVHAAAGLERGTVPRSLRAMGIDRQALQKAAEHIIVSRSAAA